MRMVANNRLGLFSMFIILAEELRFSFSNSNILDLFNEKYATSDPLIKPDESTSMNKSKRVRDNSDKATTAKGKRTNRLRREYSLSDSKIYMLVKNRVWAVLLKRKIILCISVIVKTFFSRFYI